VMPTQDDSVANQTALADRVLAGVLTIQSTWCMGPDACHWVAEVELLARMYKAAVQKQAEAAEKGGET